MIDGRLPWPLVFQVLGVAAVVWLFVATWSVWPLSFRAVTVLAGLWEIIRVLCVEPRRDYPGISSALPAEQIFADRLC